MGHSRLPAGALLGFQAELLAGRTYSHPWIPLQCWALCTFAYLLITWLFTLYTRSVQIARQRFNTLKRVLPLCPDCGMLHCHDGQWPSLDAILAAPDSLGPLPVHGCNRPRKQ